LLGSATLTVFIVPIANPFLFLGTYCISLTFPGVRIKLAKVGSVMV
jgi:hypothetical protein